MKFNDYDDLSQFNNQKDQKGLMTFYEEQWNQAHKQNKKKEEKIDKHSNHQVNHQMAKIKQLARDFRKIRRSALKELSNNIQTKSHQSIPKKVKHIKLPAKIQQSQKQVIKPFNFIARKKTLPSFSSKEINSDKQNQCLKVEQLKIMKEKLPKIKQIKNYSTVHIRIIPFQHTDPTTCENDLSRMSSELPHTRFKKGSSFKGFHRQNFSISTVGLSKDILLECHKKVDKELDEMSRNRNSLGGYAMNPLKQVSNYLFPVDPLECSFMRRLSSRNNMQENENSLNMLCKKLPNRRQQRNTANTSNHTTQNDISC